MITTITIQVTLVCFLFTFARGDTSLLESFFKSDFHIVNTNDSLMIGVGTNKPMANPGSPFNLTDVVDDTSLSFQRLGILGKSDSLWFVYYEEGGYAHSWNLVFFKKIDAGYVTLDVYWLTIEPAKNLSQLKAELTRCRFVSLDEDWKRKRGEHLAVKLSPTDYQIHSNKLK